MPVRSSTSSVLKWPDATTVREAARAWALRQATARAELERVGIFGSYARGDWGVGSDLDIVLVLTDSDRAFIERPLDWDLTEIPVPVDLLVYTIREWDALQQDHSRHASTLRSETRWIFERHN